MVGVLECFCDPLVALVAVIDLVGASSLASFGVYLI